MLKVCSLGCSSKFGTKLGDLSVMIVALPLGLNNLALQHLLKSSHSLALRAHLRGVSSITLLKLRRQGLAQQKLLALMCLLICSSSCSQSLRIGNGLITLGDNSSQSGTMIHELLVGVLNAPGAVGSNVVAMPPRALKESTPLVRQAGGAGLMHCHS